MGNGRVDGPFGLCDLYGLFCIDEFLKSEYNLANEQSHYYQT